MIYADIGRFQPGDLVLVTKSHQHLVAPGIQGVLLVYAIKKHVNVYGVEETEVFVLNDRSELTFMKASGTSVVCLDLRAKLNNKQER